MDTTGRERVVDKAAYFSTIGYTPHKLQKLFHESKARFRVPVCGRRFGKSAMAARDLEPQLFQPNQRFWIVGPTYDLGEKEFRYIWQDLIINQKLGRDKRVKKAYNKRSGDMYIEFPWQTRLEVRSATHPESLVGDSLNGVIMSEAAKHSVDTWERYIRAALADHRGWATFPTTPEGQNWLYDLWLYGRDDRFINEYASWRFPSWSNPYVYPGGRHDPEILLIERTTTPEWFEQEIAADFTAFVGKIFGEFDPNIHVKNHKFRPELPNYICFDWGFVNPLVAIEFQVDGMENIYVWREHYQAYKTLDEHVRLMKNREQPVGYHLDAGFGDAEDQQATAYMSQHLVPTLSMDEAKRNWRQGVDLIKTFLKKYPTGDNDEDGLPLEETKLYIDPSCTNLIREIGGYRTRENVSAKQRESGKASAVDGRVDDHAVDALRYGLMHLFELGAKHHLAEVVDRSLAALNGENESYFSYDDIGGLTMEANF